MNYLIVFGIGLCAGALALWFLLARWRTAVRARSAEADARFASAQSSIEQVGRQSAALTTLSERLDRDRLELSGLKKQIDSRHVSDAEILAENRMLKQDLVNIAATVRKLQMDRAEQAREQARLDTRSRELADRYLAETEKAVAASINANNYAACKTRLTKAIQWSREIGFEVPTAKETELLRTLREDFEMAVRAAVEREEQAKIKARIREEQLREREIQREMQALDRERAAIQAALDKALADTKAAHSDEIEKLRARLAEAEERGRRAVAQAQLTKSGHIYVISNIGSFGEDVYKIGMTRRLDPKERIDELGDASVPFPFDVHMMIACEDAPTLEAKLHREFHTGRINKVNPRKEFFKVDLNAVRDFVEKNHGEVRFVADAEALQYRQSIEMSSEDQAVIEAAFQHAEEALSVDGTED